MNRLILIGNGFDLAHKIPTSYNDFIKWYLIKSFKIAQTQSEYSDRFIKLQAGSPCLPIYTLSTVYEYVEHFYKKGFHLMCQETIEFQDTYFVPKNPFYVDFVNPYFSNLLEYCSDLNWVDIEVIYYDKLKTILNSNTSINKQESLKALNNFLEFIIIQLDEYLSSLDTKNSINELKDIIDSEINKKEIIGHYVRRENGPQITHILNFNYTNTVQKYIGVTQQNQSDKRVNYIHGRVSSQTHPIVFGFGDELDEDYQKMEKSNIRGYFNYIKSFWYFKTSAYHDLLRFIEADIYQIYILGHSCGLSDRTMLNMIFEHQNCASIKIYYHQKSPTENNYTTLTEDISRHFKDKALMRKRIVPFDKSEPMPQYGE